MKKTYEKPVIMKLKTGYMNKYGNNPYYSRSVRKDIDGVSIDGLIEEYGSPLFVFSEQKIRQRFREVSRAFSTCYPNVSFGWSYKTNYLSAVCGIYHQEGAMAEVVSEMEYEKARKRGVPGEKIIFNGPRKSVSAISRALDDNAMINIDHLDELYDIESVAGERGEKVSVGLRLNMDTGIHPQWTRFGFNLESGQAMDAVKRMHGGGHCVLRGLHCHIGTFILDPGAYAVQVEKMVRFACEVEDRFGFRIDYLDIGGGFPSMNRLKGTYLPPDIIIPSIDEYAGKISDALYRELRPGHQPRLIIESGRGLIDDAGYLVTTVHASKRMPDGRKAYIVDAGINLLFTSTWYKFTVEVDREVRGINEPSVIYGPLCMNIDVIDEGILLPSMGRGTRLIVSPVGAYNVTQWMQFIEYRPAVVMVCDDGTSELVRQGEDLSDVDRRELLPARFAMGAQR